LNTIDAFEKDIYLQLRLLENFIPQKPLAESVQKRTIFCGTGDSMASAMLAESFSDCRARALDPLDAIKNKNLLKGKRVYFVSISGNTISNIRAAKLVKDSTAITRNDSSRLAMTCKNVIRLDYDDSQILTSGSIGFASSMLACISLVCKFRIQNTKNLFESAKRQSNILLKNKVYVLGNQFTYPLAMYAAAKMFEVLGTDAHYERLEQFSHMGVFSAKKGDTVIIFEEKNAHNKLLVSNLKNLGLRVYQPQTNQKSKINHVIFYMFVSQLAALNNAKRKHLSDCHFVTSKKIRKASSDMIY
jgi:fructoselysine-6-P-deglycase FrlB-like protein